MAWSTESKGCLLSGAQHSVHGGGHSANARVIEQPRAIPMPPQTHSTNDTDHENHGGTLLSLTSPITNAPVEHNMAMLDSTAKRRCAKCSRQQQTRTGDMREQSDTYK